MANASFLPEDYLERKAQTRANILCMVLFLLVLAGVVSAFVVRMRQAKVEQADGRRVDALYDDAAKRLEQFDELEHKKEEMIHKARVTSALLERVPRSIILSELINNMPAAMCLKEFTLDTHVSATPVRVVTTALDKAKLDQKTARAEPEVKQMDTDVSLTGIAPTDVQVAQFMAALGRSPLFDNVNLAFSEETQVEEHTMRSFRIDMKINPDVDVTKITPTMVKRNGRVDPMNPGTQVQIDRNGKVVVPVDKPDAVQHQGIATEQEANEFIKKSNEQKAAIQQASDRRGNSK